MSAERSPTAAATRFARATALFNEARRLPEGDRLAHVQQQAAGDEALVAAVRDLLRQHDVLTTRERASPTSTVGRSRVLRDLIEVSQGTGELRDRVPERVGPFRIVRRIGVGGMGAVYEAEQDEPRRRVALKVLRAEVGTPEIVARFTREGDLLARLQHPGIASVFAAGSAAGVRYIAMELVEGQPLDQAARALALRARVELLARAADAVAYAHAGGVIHRDLKPSNILVTADGQPKVLDFGVALPLDATRHTAHGKLVGTLAYMSPEQTTGSSRVDTRSDVYALGVLCYEALAGRRPFHDEETNAASLIGALATRDPVGLEQVDRRCAATSP